MKRKIQSNEKLIKEPTKPFQEYSFGPRDATKRLSITFFKDNEKKVLTILELAKNFERNNTGFEIVFCENQNIMELAKEKDYEKVANSMLADLKNQRTFYSNSNDVRKIACERALQISATKANNGNTQSFVMFDIDEPGNLICRGGVSVNKQNNETNISVFVNTKLCENFELFGLDRFKEEQNCGKVENKKELI